MGTRPTLSTVSCSTMEGADVVITLPHMRAFEPYISSLEDLVHHALDRGSLGPDGEEVATAALDGQPSMKLRELVSISARRATGAFFTGATLAGQALQPYVSTLSDRSTVFDPA